MKLFLRSIAFIALAAFSSEAYGQYTIWRNTGDTKFEDSTNWNNGLPGPGVDVYVVPDGQGDPNGGFLVFQGGATDITINATTNQTSLGLFITDDVMKNLTLGSVTMTFAPGNTYTITDSVGVSDGETLNFSGNLTVGGSVVVGGVGDGTMSFSSGTLDVSNGALTIGTGTGNTGTFTQSGNTSSTILVSQLDVGVASATGNYTLGGAGINNLTGTTGSIFDLGTGTFTQSDTNSTVDFSQASDVFIGGVSGDNGNYVLKAGALKLNNTGVGVDSGATGALTQSGGTLTSTGFFIVGDAGTGSYSISGTTASADFQDGLTLGDLANSTGSVTQNGGTVTAEGLVTIGNLGSGTYTLTKGTATFNDGVVVGANSNLNFAGGTFSLGGNAENLTVLAGGAVTQTAGTITFDSSLNEHLDLSAAGSSYNLNGGTLQVDAGSFVSSGSPSTSGNFNGGGGTLQINGSGAFVDPYNGSLTKGTVTTIDASNGTITSVEMAGGFSDGGGGGAEGGGIRFLGSSSATAFSFDSDNTYTGKTILQTGTLTATTNQVGSSNLINLVNADSILDLSTATAGVNTLAGELTGPGALNVSFANSGDTLALTNPSASQFPGSLNIGGTNGNAGTLEIFNGKFGAITDTNNTGSGVNIGEDPSGTIVGPATGSVTFSQSQTYTGATTVYSGFSLFGPGFAGDVINNGGTLGTLGTLNNPASMLINGNLTSNGTLVIHVNGLTSDSFNVTGAANLSNLIKVVGVGTNTYNIVTTNGGVTIRGNGNLNDPNGLTTTSPSTLFSSTLSIVGDDLVLSTTQQPVGEFAKTPNEQAVAGAIDKVIASGGPFNGGYVRVLTGLNNLTPAAIPAALESLTPESLQYSRIIAFENSTFLVQRMNGVDNDLRAGYGGLDTNAVSVAAPGFNSGLGRSLGSLLASASPDFHAAAPNGVNYYPGASGGASDSGSVSVPEASPMPGWEPSSQVISDTPNPYMANQHPSGPDAPAFNEFVSGDLVLADLNQDLSATNAPSTKASYTAEDATAGVSYRFTSHFSAGVLFDYNHTDADTDGHGSKTTIDTYTPGLYATYFDHGFYANGLFAFGYNEYTSNRVVPFLGDTAHSTPTGEQYTADIDVGYDFHPNPSWVVGPTLGVTYTHLDIGSFSETGSLGDDLSVDGQSADSVRTRLGGHVIFQTNTGDVLLQPNFTASWQHEYLNNSAEITSTSDLGPFTIRTASPGRDSALLGVGLTATLSNSLALTLNYMADVGASDYFAQSLMGGLKVRF